MRLPADLPNLTFGIAGALAEVAVVLVAAYDPDDGDDADECERQNEQAADNAQNAQERLHRRNPVWRDNWQRFVPILELHQEIRKVVYTKTKSSRIWLVLIVFGRWSRRFVRCV